MNKPFLSVVVPAYNEEANFKREGLEAVYDYLTKQAYSFELILIDDGSTDKTLNNLNEFARGKAEVRVIKSPHRGKGPTVKEGMLQARGVNRLFTDFDQSTPIREVEKLLQYRQEGFEIVIGSREATGAKREAEPWYRHLMGKGFNLGVKLLTVKGIKDTQCGFKLFSEKVARDIFSRIIVTLIPRKDAFTGALDVELLYLAQKRHYRIAEVPVHWQHIKSTRVNPVRDSVRMAVEVIRIKLADLEGRYEI